MLFATRVDAAMVTNVNMSIQLVIQSQTLPVASASISKKTAAVILGTAVDLSMGKRTLASTPTGNVFVLVPKRKGVGSLARKLMKSVINLWKEIAALEFTAVINIQTKPLKQNNASSLIMDVLATNESK